MLFYRPQSIPSLLEGRTMFLSVTGSGSAPVQKLRTTIREGDLRQIDFLVYPSRISIGLIVTFVVLLSNCKIIRYKITLDVSILLIRVHQYIYFLCFWSSQ